MSFLAPLAFTLTLLLPAIIAMYLLKLRRKDQVVSSTYLWQRMVRDLEANAPWQRLRRNLLLLLQLLFLIILIFSLARPFTWASGSTAQSIIWIFDTSASMGASDVSPNRLESAKAQARLSIANLPEGARGTIITAGDHTRVLVSASQDKRQLTGVLESVQIQPGSSDLTGALELASALAVHEPDVEIIIFSDGRVSLPEQLAVPGNIRFMSVGTSGENQAISRVIFDPQGGETAAAFVQVANYAAASVQRRLLLHADGTLVHAQDIEIPPGGHTAVVSELVPGDTQILEASLSGSDALTLDDRAWAVGSGHQERKISLVSPGDRFLETAVELLPAANLATFAPGEQALEGAPDLVIYDKVTPPAPLPVSSNILHIGPVTDTLSFSILGRLENPVPQPARADDPLLAHVDLSGVNILDSSRLSLPDWARPVIIDQETGAPLLFVGETEGRRIGVLAFDPLRSDLPLQPAYPILMANLAEWLLPGSLGQVPASAAPGDAVQFTPPPEVASLSITRPDGTTAHLDNQDGRVIFADTDQTGVYNVTWGDGGSLAFAVNLFDPQESNILPEENLPLFSGESGAASAGPGMAARSEWWRPLAAIALFILMVEWLVYNRSTLVKQLTLIRGFSRHKDSDLTD